MTKIKIKWEAVTTCLVSIIGIYISCQANNISQLQAEIARNSVLPNIQVNETYEMDEEGKVSDTIIEISNEEGRLNNYHSNIVTFLEGIYIDEEMNEYEVKIPVSSYYFLNIHSGENRDIIEVKYTAGNYEKKRQLDKLVLEYNYASAFSNLDMDIQSYLKISYVDLLGEEINIYYKTDVNESRVIDEREGINNLNLYNKLYEENYYVDFNFSDVILIEELIEKIILFPNDIQEGLEHELNKIEEDEFITWSTLKQILFAIMLLILCLLVGYTVIISIYQTDISLIPTLYGENGTFYIDLLIVNNSKEIVCIEGVTIADNDKKCVCKEKELLILKPYNYIIKRIKWCDDSDNTWNQKADINISVQEVGGNVHKVKFKEEVKGVRPQ